MATSTPDDRGSPRAADLAWASFPCQDLSLAGKQKGLSGERSGSFWGFWRLMQQLQLEGRTVPLIVLENVVGTISSRNGEDFNVLLDTLASGRYRVGPLVLNAVHWVPQSRPRLFVIGVHDGIELPQHLRAYTPSTFLHPAALQRAFAQAPEQVREAWVWWNLPKPTHRKMVLADVIEEHPTSVRWHTEDETRRLYELMPAIHRAKVSEAQRKGRVGGHGVSPHPAERAERKGASGRSAFRWRQRLPTHGVGRVEASSSYLWSRVTGCAPALSTCEAARLMGIPEEYQLPENYSDAYHLLGDGLAVPVVAWLERNLLTPLLGENPVPVSLPVGIQAQSDDAEAALQLVLFERQAKGL